MENIVDSQKAGLVDLEVEHTSEQPEIIGNTIKVRDWDVYYIKVGHGPKVVFISPGTFGTIYTDYPYLVNAFDEEKFTAIFWDTPGYGKSRPPERDFTSNSGNYYVTDADLAYEFLRALGIKKYSIVGWCAAGITGMIHAAKHPENVEKLVIWGSKAHITEEELATFEVMSDIENWSPRMSQPKIDIYGKEVFRNMLAGYANALSNNFKPDGNICKEYLKDIKCPTFILHGGRDPILPRFQFEYLCDNIKNVKTLEYPEGSHNPHLKYHVDFNKQIQKFLLEL